VRITSLCSAHSGQIVRLPAILAGVTGTKQISYDHPPPGREHICAYSIAVEWTPQEIKNRRLAKGWDQDRLATELGVSRRAITNWETGSADPRGKNRRRLDDVLGDTPQPETSLQNATDAQFIAELARRLALRAQPPQLPGDDLWWPRTHPQGQEPPGDPDDASGAQEG
jgi:transcriptional regulator with XRE-family HTH domain